LFQKIPFHRQLADLGMQILEATGIHLRLRRVAAPLEYLRRAVKKRLLPLVDHRRVDLKPALQLSNCLFTLQGLKGHSRLELRLVLLSFRHR
jgi:hypothetical protein